MCLVYQNSNKRASHVAVTRCDDERCFIHSYDEYCDNGDDDDDFPKKVARCAFRDDEEFMLKFHKSHRKYVPMCHDTSLFEPAPRVSYFWTFQLISITRLSRRPQASFKIKI
jgi:hypothetical protein